MNDRIQLKNRRVSSTVVIEHGNNTGNDGYIVTFGYAADGTIREAFCTSPKTGSDQQAFINDACIAISLLLQHGLRAAQLAKSFSEERSMMKPNEQGPPSSPLGAIARMAATIEAENEASGVDVVLQQAARLQ